ncbi:synaptotagmin-6 isoform X2 [Nematostella vectensis]|nr:synaptotagmin-6 isoform X2 [Nematostella vectensis]
MAMLSMLCWRKFRNLSLREQFLDYREVPTSGEKEDRIEGESELPQKITPGSDMEDILEKPVPILRQVQRGPMKHYAKHPPPPWTPKPELSVVSVQPLENDKENEDEDPVSSSSDEDEGATSPVELAAPYDIREIPPPEQHTSPKDAEFLGRLYFSLRYNGQRSLLEVRVIKGEEFPPYLGQAPDVFMEVRLSPAMKNSQLKTEIHERASHPTFNEVFEFGLPYDEIKTQTLHLSLQYMDKYSHAFSVGEVVHPLDHLEHEQETLLREEMIVCREILKLTQQDSDKSRDLGFGQILFSLMYMPLTRRLTIVVFKARDLKPLTEGYPAVYAEVVLVNSSRRIRKRKATTVKNSTLNPVYNEAMAFDAANMKLEDVKLQIFVKQKLEGVPDKIMGRVVLGTSAEDLEREHWNEAMTAKKPIARWHSLREFHNSLLPTRPNRTSKPIASSTDKKAVPRYFATSSESEG